MQIAEYPEKKCRDPLFNAHSMGYSCELPALHPGPCATNSIADSVTNRDRWEDKNPDWRANMRTGDIEI